MHILIADDNLEIRAALRLLAEELGHVVREAGAAKVLFEELRFQPVDLLLLDWELPGFCPEKHIPQLRQIGARCVIAAMSGRPEAQPESAHLGVEVFVGKNSPPDRLLQLIRETESR